MKSIREVRLTCKKWNTFSKHIGKAAAAREGEFQGIVLIKERAVLITVNLHGIHNNTDSFIERRGKLISLKDSDDVVISRIYHCEGLLLCAMQDNTWLVVWNPYTGQTRRIWIEHKTILKARSRVMYANALGYEKSKSCRAYKILRFATHRWNGYVHEIYEFNSNSWRVLDVTKDWSIEYYFGGVSLKGNTYWRARARNQRENVPAFLIGFDFTTERFGPHLPLPFESYTGTVTLSTLGEEQLAVLFQQSGSYELGIWVTTKIEPNTVSWSKFLAVDMRPLNHRGFLIDKEKRAVVVFHDDRDVMNRTRQAAYIQACIIGENGDFREVNIGKITDHWHYLLICSYVPSSVLF